MREITAYVTRDDIVHSNYQSAKSHAEKQYGDQLTKMAHELVAIEKYSDMLDKLDGYKGSMRRLLNLSADLIIEQEES